MSLHTHTHIIVCCHAVHCNQFYISVCRNICGELPSSVLVAKKESKDQNDSIDSTLKLNPCYK